MTSETTDRCGECPTCQSDLADIAPCQRREGLAEAAEHLRALAAEEDETANRLVPNHSNRDRRSRAKGFRRAAAEIERMASKAPPIVPASIWVKCRVTECGEVWPAVNLPMPLPEACRALLKARCPLCGDNKPVMASRNDMAGAERQ